MDSCIKKNLYCIINNTIKLISECFKNLSTHTQVCTLNEWRNWRLLHCLLKRQWNLNFRSLYSDTAPAVLDLPGAFCTSGGQDLDFKQKLLMLVCVRCSMQGLGG